MYVRMTGLYNGNYEAWYRKQGDGCFDFVRNKKFASDMTEEECQDVINHKEFYFKQFNASGMVIEK